jgi:hypothetical protein
LEFTFVKFGAEFVVVDFVASSQVGFGVGEEFVGANAAQVILADAL